VNNALLGATLVCYASRAVLFRCGPPACVSVMVLRCLRLGALGPFQDSSSGFLGRLACLPLSLVVAQIDDSGKRRPCPGGAGPKATADS
jgi:hypothetical protein